MKKIQKIVSGGQSGVDRAALDFAIQHQVPYGGWCPKGGWAEDLTEAPGLLLKYNNLKETPLAEVSQRTKWNVRDSDATIIVYDSLPGATSKGTDLTVDTAVELKRPFLQVNINDPIDISEFRLWFSSIKDSAILNIAGPRESESPGVYEKTLKFLRSILFEVLPENGLVR